MRLALLLAVLPGLGLGFLLISVVGLGLPLSMPWPQFAQGHGQVQLFGFVPLFIIAVGLQLFPRFLSAPPAHPERAVLGGWLIAGAVLTRLLAQSLPPGAVRPVLLLIAAVAVPAGIALALAEFWSLRRRSVQPMSGAAASWQWFILVGALALASAAVLHGWGLTVLANGNVVVPTGLSEALIHVELLGFATCLVLGISSRILGRFLLLRSRPSLDRHLPRIAMLYGLGLALVATGWVLEAVPLRLVGYAAEAIAVGVWVWLIGLYDRPSRASGMPHVTDPTRRWLRLAFGFLLLGLALAVFLAARGAAAGVPASGTEISAARHAVAQGFLLVVMVGMAARLLPIYSADVLRRPKLLEATASLLLVGAGLRAGAEWVGGYAGLAGPLTTLGGLLALVGFTVFAAGLWSSLGRLPGRMSGL
jgi:hypothetical protein